MQAHKQWLSRPADERFVSLDDMYAAAAESQANSRGIVASSRSITVEPKADNAGLQVVGPNGTPYAPTHWAFGQLCQRAELRADMLREKLPAPLAADCLNWRFKVAQAADDIGLCLYQNGGPAMLTAATGPNYGRIWDAEPIDTIRKLFGNGEHSNKWHVPVAFNGKAETITKDNTTLYRGDRDWFVFLTDGAHDIGIPNRRNGQTGRAQRGFFCWGSQVGARSQGFGTFIFDFMCSNHIVWGAQSFEEVRIRHTASAPERWLEELVPALEAYANGSTEGIQAAIAAAQAKRLTDKADEFMAARFGAGMAAKFQAVHMLEEQRPIETVFDVVTAATAYAKSIPWIGERVELERQAGKLLAANERLLVAA
jgi:hypothetical protein